MSVAGGKFEDPSLPPFFFFLIDIKRARRFDLMGQPSKVKLI